MSSAKSGDTTRHVGRRVVDTTLLPYVRVDVLQYDLPLLPFIDLREAEESKRAIRARSVKNQIVKSIPIRFPSVNHMYPINRRNSSKYLSEEGRLYKAYISEQMALIDGSRDFRLPIWEFYVCTYVYFMTYAMMYTKLDDPRKTDVSNYIKATEDAVFEYLLENDSRVTSVAGHKRVTLEDPHLVILLSEGSPYDTIWHVGQEFDFEGVS